MLSKQLISDQTCADPENFVRGGPIPTFFCFYFVGMKRGSKCHLKWAIIGPPAKCHKMALRWRADKGPPLNAVLVALCFLGDPDQYC